MADDKDKRMVLRNSGRTQSPFSLWEDMDSLFDEFRRDLGKTFWEPFDMRLSPTVRRTPKAYTMPMNLEDKGEEFALTVDMPGVRKDNAKISLNEDILTISVEGDEKKEEKEENYLLRERSTFSCSRSIQLPAEVKADKIEAEMKEGVLHVKLPKEHPKKKKEMDIKIK